MLLFAAVRLAALTSANNEQLLIRIGNQQVVTLDLRQGLPINPDLLGANVFPPFGTSSQDKVNGFMHYSPALTAGLVDAHIKLLRFPGGKWGEDHLLSNDQLSAFSTLLEQTDANGMVQFLVALSSSAARIGIEQNGGFAHALARSALSLAHGSLSQAN